MPLIYRISGAGLRLYYKIRHHRGHGVHSPFVYKLITNVIEEKNLYYLYKDIQELVCNEISTYSRVTKSDFLSFRLVNFFNPKKILEIGSGKGINTLCLSAPSKQIECKCFETDKEKYEIASRLYKNWDRDISLHTQDFPEINEKQDCIYINLDNHLPDADWITAFLFNFVNEDSFIIMKGIRTKKSHQTLWKILKKSEKVSVSLDLYNEGILFFNSKLHKRNYKISF